MMILSFSKYLTNIVTTANYEDIQILIYRYIYVCVCVCKMSGFTCYTLTHHTTVISPFHMLRGVIVLLVITTGVVIKLVQRLMADLHKKF